MLIVHLQRSDHVSASASFLPHIAAAQDVDVWTEEELEVLSMVRQADLGIQRVYVEPGLYYYDHAPIPDDYQWNGGFLWRYDGQQMFVDSGPSPSVVQFVEPDYVLTGPEFDPDAYFGVGDAVRVDRYGRRWVLDYVDVSMVTEDVGSIDAALGIADPNLDSGTAQGDTGLAGIEFNDDAGVIHEVELTSWDVVECPPDTYRYFSDHVGNGGMAHPVPLGYPNSAVVWVITPGAPACTGTVVWGAAGGVRLAEQGGESVRGVSPGVQSPGGLAIPRIRYRPGLGRGGGGQGTWSGPRCRHTDPGHGHHGSGDHGVRDRKHRDEPRGRRCTPRGLRAA